MDKFLHINHTFVLAFLAISMYSMSRNCDDMYEQRRCGMYQFFQQCFQQYLSLYSEEIAENERLLTLFAPFYGLANPKNYEAWKLSSDIRYFEVSHLV